MDAKLEKKEMKLSQCAGDMIVNNTTKLLEITIKYNKYARQNAFLYASRQKLEFEIKKKCDLQ